MYQYVTFEGVTLPLFNHQQQHDPMPAESTLVDSIGGAYDWRGSQRRAGRKQTIPLTGVYLGETTYLVDEAGNYLIDEAGNYVIAGNGEQAALSKVAAIMALVGTRGQLWRKRLADDVLQWKTARLLTNPNAREYEDHGVRATVKLQFETQMEFWHAATATTASGSTTSGVPKLINVEVSGQTVNDAVLTIACTSGTITAIAITCTTLGIDLSWGSNYLANGDVLTIDCGDNAVSSSAVDAYAGFSKGDDHTARGWLPLSAGTHIFTVTTTGGAATVTFTYYGQSA